MTSRDQELERQKPKGICNGRELVGGTETSFRQPSRKPKMEVLFGGGTGKEH